ncbi:MAG: gamma-glutamyl-gamma-aminobutyrate hydrolase family protein [Gammaproteobacteria bacterium]
MLSIKDYLRQQEKELSKKITDKERSLHIPSLNTYYMRPDEKAKKIATQHEKAKNTPTKISITYRNDGSGKGAVFDHHTMQQIAGVETILAHSENKSTREFVEHMRTNVHDLKFGKETEESMGRKIPPRVSEAKDCDGLLFIPGVARTMKATREYEFRKEYNFTLLKKAKLTGQPVLGICGGAWEVWQYYEGEVKEVKGHNYRAGMPRMKNNGKIGNNKQIHQIILSQEAHILKGAMQKNEKIFPKKLTANSVHWLACDEKKVPDIFCISARAKHDPELAPGGKVCQNGTIEAVESIAGAPILLLQWHPEAYFQNTASEYHPQLHQNIIHYMAKAGHAYSLKRKMIDELASHINCENDETFMAFKKTILKPKGLLKNLHYIIFYFHEEAKQFYIKFSEYLDPSLRHEDEYILDRRTKINRVEEICKDNVIEVTDMLGRNKFKKSKQMYYDIDKDIKFEISKKADLENSKITFVESKRVRSDDEKPSIATTTSNSQAKNALFFPVKKTIRKKRKINHSAEASLFNFFDIKPKPENPSHSSVTQIQIHSKNLAS